MAYDNFKYRVLTGIFEIAGNVISSQITKPNWDEQEKLREEYYEQLKQAARENDKKERRDRAYILREEKIEMEQPIEEKQYVARVARDLTEPKIQGGTACLPCSRDHFSTVSGALNEAIRFSRREGVAHPEVARRLGMALDELNMLERIDLSAEELTQLKGKEKKLAEWGLEKSRMLRHKITSVTSHEELERVAATASKVRTEFMKNLWDVATVDGSISKLCKGLQGDEYNRCVATINEVLNEKNKTPP